MGKPDRIKVFVSYARKDGADLAGRLQRDLAANGLEVWLDTARLHGGDSWSTEIETAIDHSQVVLALLTPGSFASDICRAEQLRSLRKAKTVIPVLAQDGTDIPLHLEAKNYRDLARTKSYRAQFRLLLDDIRTRRNSVILRQEFRTTRVTAPPLPRNYIERPEALLSLRNAVIAHEPGPCLALVALRGMGGIGKTVLAQALSRDEVVQQAFPDGIIWTSVGKEPRYDLVGRMQEVRRALEDEPAEKESELECINRYRSILRDKAALVIVDDVWRIADIEPFLAESLRSRLLFTTRNASIGAALGANEHMAGLLNPEQSRSLLSRWAGLASADLPDEADDLIGECGRLPLAISMIGAMLRGKPPAYWVYVGNLLRQADLAKIEVTFPGYPHTDLLRAIQVSVDALDDAARKRYIALAVLPKDMVAPQSVQQTLWNTDEGDSLATSEQFISLSLAQREGESGGIRLHDLQIDYVRSQYPDRDAIDLIRGAVLLSTHVIERDARQFASQVIGRLLPYQDVTAIAKFAGGIADGAPGLWLRPLWPSLDPPGNALIRTLEGSSGPIARVAVTANWRWAVSAAAFDLELWDLETGRKLRTLTSHSQIANLAISADGRRAVTACRDKVLHVWDLETGRELNVLVGHTDEVNGVAVSSDGLWIVSASNDKTLKVWDLETGRELRTLAGHSDSVMAVAFCPDGRRVVSGSKDCTLRVWDVENGHELGAFEGHSDRVSGVAVDADGRLVVSASWDQTLKVWDLGTGRELHTLTGHAGAVDAVAVGAGGRLAASASFDSSIKVWELETGRELRTLTGHDFWVTGVALSSDGRQAVSAGRNIKLWDLGARHEFHARIDHFGYVSGVAIGADGRRAVSASGDCLLKVWDLEAGRELRTLAGHSRAITGVAVSADGKICVSASLGQTLKVWNLDTGHEIRSLVGYSSLMGGVAISADGRRAISDGLRMWDLEDGHEILTLAGHSANVMGVAMSADGRLAVSASSDRTLKVWDLEAGRELRTLVGHRAQVLCVALTLDGRRAVSGSVDQTLKVWDVENGNELRSLSGHFPDASHVALSRNGRLVVSSSYDRTLKVWDLDIGVHIASFTCDGMAPRCAFIGNDKIIAGDGLGRLHIFSLQQGRLPMLT